MRQECKRIGEEIGKEEDGMASQRRVVKPTQMQSAKERQEQEKEEREDSRVNVSNA